METFWEIDFNKKEKLSIDEAKFIFEQAEKQLKDTVESSELIINRTNTLITLVSGVLIALLGITVSKMETSSLDSIFFAGTLGSIYLFIIGIYIMKNIQPAKYVIVGEPPKTYFDDIYYSVEPSDETTRLLWYYINTIQQYQKRIELNDKRRALDNIINRGSRYKESGYL
ncbi:hypothetical protein AB6735_24460 [Mucilaginibacter sp. RCC_168]|uniref:hypothetical protein n=1 Tax=Mucilaginibacter sp. RCC_168 TaxID=3239221 RepID=UPI003525009E